jgi:hypothetical protein
MLSLLLIPSSLSALNFRPASSRMANMLTLILTGLLRRSDRLLWVLLSRLWNGWADARLLVKPATVIRCQRTGFQLVLDLEEPPEGTRPPGRRPGAPSAHPTDVRGQPHLGRAADSRGTSETGRRDLPGDGLQVRGQAE